MTDDFGWFWAGEHGRDQILRDSVDDLHAQLSSSSRQSSRLSSQLAELKGSMEGRLTALSIAFDAYVELGDIREQLTGYPDTSQIRREVRDSLTAVTAGRTAAPIDPRGLPYWLPYATNAVLAIAAGRTDPDAEDTARSLSPESELFMVAAAGAVGHGAAVAHRLPDLLIGDGTLSPAQVVLWRAAGQGRFGEVDDVLARIEPLWRSSLAESPPAEWLHWVRDQTDGGSLESVEWIRRTTVHDPGPAPVSSDRDHSAPRPAGESVPGESALRQLVSDLAGRGVGDEAALLLRARELRALIESPTSTPANTGTPPNTGTTEAGADAGPAGEPVRTAVPEVVRQTLLDTPPGSPAHRVVLGWLAPALTAVLEATEAEAARAPSFTESVSTRVGAVEVSSSGADPATVDQRAAALRSDDRPSPAGIYVFGAVAVVALVVAVVMLVVSSAGPWALFLMLAGAAVVGAFYHLRQRVAFDKEAESEVDRLRGKVTEAEARTHAAEQSWRTELDAIRRSAEQARAGLRRPTVASDPAALR